MTEATPGYTALHESAAWLDLSARGKLRVTGDDRVRLLHAMLSNDVKSLAPGQGNYNFLLSVQGHILADAWLYVMTDSILLDLEPEATMRALEHLNRHIIADDVEIADVTKSLGAIALEGPRADEFAGIPVPAQSGSHVERDGMIVARVSSTGQPGLRFFVDPAGKAALIARFERTGAVAATPEDAYTVRVENGLPRYGDDFDQTSLPQEIPQLQAVSFNKGCYLGQEIVERIRARGQVHKVLVKISIDGRAWPVETGTPVTHTTDSGERRLEQEVGRLTSPAYSPRQRRALGFAILRREVIDSGAPVGVGIHPGQIVG